MLTVLFVNAVLVLIPTQLWTYAAPALFCLAYNSPLIKVLVSIPNSRFLDLELDLL